MTFYEARSSHRLSKSDLTSRSTGSINNHLKLTRTKSRDWGSDAYLEHTPGIRSPYHRNVENLREHPKLHVVRSDGSSGSLRNSSSHHRSKPMIRKSRSVDIRENTDHRSAHRHRSLREHQRSSSHSEHSKSRSRRYGQSDSMDLLQLPSHETTLSDYVDSTTGSSLTSLRNDGDLCSSSGVSADTLQRYNTIDDSVESEIIRQNNRHDILEGDSDTQLDRSGEDSIHREININENEHQQISGTHIKLTMQTPSGQVAKVNVEGDGNEPLENSSGSVDDTAMFTLPPKSSPEDEESRYDVDVADDVTDTTVGGKASAGNHSPQKHPLRDSAYQSKEQSTEKSNSTAVSPTLGNSNLRPKEDVFTLHKPMPAR